MVVVLLPCQGMLSYTFVYFNDPVTRPVQQPGRQIQPAFHGISPLDIFSKMATNILPSLSTWTEPCAGRRSEALDVEVLRGRKRARQCETTGLTSVREASSSIGIKSSIKSEYIRQIRNIWIHIHMYKQLIIILCLFLFKYGLSLQADSLV